MRTTRIQSYRSSKVQPSHIRVQDHLIKKSQLLQKYQTEMRTVIDRIDTKGSKLRNIDELYLDKRRTERQRSQSIKNATITLNSLPNNNDNLNDYQKVILTLEYALQTQCKKRQILQTKNISLQNQISNLRNILIGHNGQNQYEKTVLKEYQEKINILEGKLASLKKNYDFIIETKDQQIGNTQLALRTLSKKIQSQQKDIGWNKKTIQLMDIIDQLKSSIAKKNITLQKLMFHDIQEEDSEQEREVKEITKSNKIQFYFNQLQISNRLILKKNAQILNYNKKINQYVQIISIIEQYLDKKQVKNVDLSILQHPCISKLRTLMRQKAVFEKELMDQLAIHQQKMDSCEEQLLKKNEQSEKKNEEITKQNKRLNELLSSQQENIRKTKIELDIKQQQSQSLKNQLQRNKKAFVEQILKLKNELTNISSITKNEFDRMKIQNLKLSQQNKSLLFLVGEKQKQIQKKAQVLKTFSQYKTKINSLNIPELQKRKIEQVSQQNSFPGSTLLLINNFSQWMIEWNKIRNWSNKKVLLNIIIDKEQIVKDSLNSMTYLVNVLHQSFLTSKNVQIQQRAIILLSLYLKHSILKNINLFVDKIAPLILRGFRQQIQGQDNQKHRILNESSLKIVSELHKVQFKWSSQMTNQMLSVNGLKYLFNIITTSQVDELVQCSYNCLTLIAKQNQMISFMNSFNITSILLNNINAEYSFLIYELVLLRTLLQSRDFLKSQKSLLDFRKLYLLLKDQEDDEQIDLTLDCILILMENSLFVKSVNKIETINILNQSISKNEDYNILKKIGDVYNILLSELQTENIQKMIVESQILMKIISHKQFSQNKFNRALRILLKITEILTQNHELDEKVMIEVSKLYDHYGQIENKSKIKLNQIVNTIYERNKQVINKYSNQHWIESLVQTYKQCVSNEQNIFLLKILLFQHQQKRTTQILRTGRQALISKYINDALIPDYNIANLSLKNLLAISKEKYSQKFVNKSLFSKIINKILSSRNEEDYLGTAISIIYFFCKQQQSSNVIIELGLVEKVFKIITQRHDKQNLIYKCFTLLQLCHLNHYKKKILNYLLSNDPNLQILKTVNFVLKKAKNKPQMGIKVVFLYDFLNSKTAVESLALLIEQNVWMMQDLIDVRNQYISKADPLVYKIELLLHNMSKINAKVRKIYEKFKIEGEYESQDDK